MPEVRPATEADLPAIGRALAASFADDPLWMWMTSPNADWDAVAPGWFSAEAKAHLGSTTKVLVDDDVRGVAIWSAPGHWKPTAREALALAVPSLRLFRGGFVRALRGLSSIEKVHPKEPDHWYLALLGTDPAHQGQGIGSALIRAVTDTCDEQGLPAYLESSKETNLPFYSRHGFVDSEPVTVPDGPSAWPMWREPRG